MRIIQIIDSLEAGGAERMAVNYANGLASRIDFSGIVATRKEGPLLNQISKSVSYLFLNKKSSIDLKAVFRLRKFVIENNVEIVHAHSTSYFLAFLLKLSYPSLQLIWHDHYGNSEFLSKRPLTGLKICLPFFKGSIAVNQQLKIWAEKTLHFKNVIYLANFPTLENEGKEHTVLLGIQGKRIVSLANLRVQKNHFLLVDVAKKVKESHPEWTFHLIGKDFEDVYSEQIKKLIVEYNLDKSVFIYGSRADVKNILKQSTIAVLTSQSEGLPVALLEYGLNNKPIVVTNVGEIPLIVKNGVNGFMVATADVQMFYESLIMLMENDSLQNDFSTALHGTISSDYSEGAVIKQYIDWISNSIK